MRYNLFLDDFRQPQDCLNYMSSRIGSPKTVELYLQKEWAVVKNYPEFCSFVSMHKGLIDLVSFDHDLADGHYHKNMQEGVLNYNLEDFLEDDYNKTGYHCALYLIDVYTESNLELPQTIVHSMNPVGTKNIQQLFEKYTR